MAFKVRLIILSLDIDWINQFIKAWPNTSPVYLAQVDGIVVIWESQLLLWWCYACIQEVSVYGQVVWQDHHHGGAVFSIALFSTTILIHLLVLFMPKSVLRKVYWPYSVWAKLRFRMMSSMRAFSLPPRSILHIAFALVLTYFWSQWLQELRSVEVGGSLVILGDWHGPWDVHCALEPHCDWLDNRRGCIIYLIYIKPLWRPQLLWGWAGLGGTQHLLCLIYWLMRLQVVSFRDLG